MKISFLHNSKVLIFFFFFFFQAGNGRLALYATVQFNQ